MPQAPYDFDHSPPGGISPIQDVSRPSWLAVHRSTLRSLEVVLLQSTVAREVGHSSTAMIEKVYGHLGQIQHRSEVVEYRVRQHRKAIARLRQTLRQQAISWTRTGTSSRSAPIGSVNSSFRP